MTKKDDTKEGRDHANKEPVNGIGGKIGQSRLPHLGDRLV